MPKWRLFAKDLVFLPQIVGYLTDKFTTIEILIRNIGEGMIEISLMGSKEDQTRAGKWLSDFLCNI